MPSRSQASWRPHNGQGAASSSACHTVDGSIETNHLAGANGSSGVLQQVVMPQLDSSGDTSDVPGPLETSGGWADDIMLTLPKPFLDEHNLDTAASAAATMYQQRATSIEPAPHVVQEMVVPQPAVPDISTTGTQRRSVSGAPCIGRAAQARKSDGHGSVSGVGAAWINRSVAPRNQGRSSPAPGHSSPTVPMSSILKDSRWSQGARSASSFARGSSARERHTLPPAPAQAIPIGWRSQGHCVSDGASTPQAAGPVVPTPQPAVPPVPIAAWGQGGGRGSCPSRGSTWVTRDSLGPSGVRVVQPQGVSTSISATRSISPAAPESRQAATPNRTGLAARVPATQVVGWPATDGVPAPPQCANPFVLELGTVQSTLLPSSAAPGSLSGRLVQPTAAGTPVAPSVCMQASPRGNMSVPFGTAVARWRVSSSPRQRVSVGGSHAVNPA
mmetsp:Transcript_19707/g.35679  ORF Transcript_19707/g.35679 Transcript_19707/m.35679 type:complete len:444 (+) Transcript_19707:143-1474(+)